MWILRPLAAIFVALVLAAGYWPERAGASQRGPAPSFWDPGLHLERPDLSALRAIRFLTDDDYPPLDFALADGSLSGFNVDIARAICEELHIGCTIQARRWDTLIELAGDGQGRRGDRLDRDERGDARPDRFHPALLSDAGAVRGAQGFAAQRTRRRLRSPAKASASSPARRINPISRRSSRARR